MMDYEIKPYSYHGDCLFVKWDDACMVFSLEFGPRIVSFTVEGSRNIMYEQPKGADFLSTTLGWRVHAGTRLWLAPESNDSYFPDNLPVSYEFRGDCLSLRGAPDPWLGITKEIKVTPCGKGAAYVDYRISNTGDSNITGSPWAISSVIPGGTLTIPFRSACTDSFNPDRYLALWGGTSLADPRLRFGADCIRVTADISVPEYFKLGLLCHEAYAVYETDDLIFRKEFGFSRQPFEDGNSNLEVFACQQMIEIETLGTKVKFAPGNDACHREKWTLERKGEHHAQNRMHGASASGRDTRGAEKT